MLLLDKKQASVRAESLDDDATEAVVELTPEFATASQPVAARA